jgi:hypothetical protein
LSVKSGAKRASITVLSRHLGKHPAIRRADRAGGCPEAKRGVFMTKHTSLTDPAQLDLADLVAAISQGVAQAQQRSRDVVFPPGLGPITIGIVLQPPEFGKPWPTAAVSTGRRTLDVSDHTRLIDAMMTYPLHLLRALDSKTPRPVTEAEALAAALKVTVYPDDVRETLRRCAEFLPRYEALRDNPTPELQKNLDAVREALTGKPMKDALQALDDLASQRSADDRFLDSLAVARAILVDGADTIYSPSHPFYQLGGRSALRDAEDGIGIGIGDVLGGIIGSVAGPAGAILGAGVASLSGGATVIVLSAFE